MLYITSQLPICNESSLVQRLGYGPFKAETRVRFPDGESRLLFCCFPVDFATSSRHEDNNNFMQLHNLHSLPPLLVLISLFSTILLSILHAIVISKRCWTMCCGTELIACVLSKLCPPIFQSIRSVAEWFVLCEF